MITHNTNILNPNLLIGDESIGGKARNLLILDKLGLEVPKWTVIPSSVLTEQLPPDVDEKNIAHYLENLVVPNNLVEELQAYFGNTNKHFAVRSSCSDEDGIAFSFAGQFDTFLGVKMEDIPTKVKALWQSIASDHVLFYRKKNKLPMNWEMSVIVQEMLVPTVSGVAFGIDPIEEDTDTSVISAVYGLGEGLVSGDLPADTFSIKGDDITTVLAIKEEMLVDNGVGKLIKEPIPLHLQEKPCLNETQLKEIVEVLDKLDEHYGHPQDIEYAYVGDQFYLLQTRSITTISSKEKGEYIVWDNSNIVESYPGITTPLTFSFIIKMYEAVYRQFVQLLGVTPNEVEQNADVFANTLGLVRGRVYYNLLSWYKMLAMVPGYSLNAPFMETMMGVKERFELKESYQMSKGLAWWRILTMSLKMIWLQITLPQKRRTFKTYLDEVIGEYQAIDFSAYSPKAIIEKYNELEQSLLLEWKAPLINDFFSMIWFGLLQKQSEKLFPDSPNLHNDLLCGSQDIISVEPIHRTIAICDLIRENQLLTTIFKEEEPRNILNILQQNEHQKVKQAIDAYLKDFGDRCVGELKLETIGYTQNPSKFIGVIKTYLINNIQKKKGSDSVEEKVRTAAEEKVSAALKNKPLKKMLFNFIKRNARDLVSNRENLRYERTRGFGMVRKMFVALGKHWYKEGKLDDPRDIFYVKLEEIKTLGGSGLFDADMKSIIEERKDDFKRYRNEADPSERFSTYGKDFCRKNIYSKEKMVPLTGELKGIGCCPGRVKARVQVITDPQSVDSLNGDILVTSSTDPGWVTLFPTASAIIVERGSLLSHSAIVAREMSIPCIVGVTGLLRTLKTGDVVEMDGSSGVVAVQ